MLHPYRICEELRRKLHKPQKLRDILLVNNPVLPSHRLCVSPNSELMIKFYRNLEQGLDKGQALRQAMLETMKDHPHPRDWAAFALMGES